MKNINKLACDTLQENLEDMIIALLGVTSIESEEYIEKFRMELQSIVYSFGDFIENTVAYGLKITIESLSSFFIIEFVHKIRSIKKINSFIEFCEILIKELETKKVII